MSSSSSSSSSTELSIPLHVKYIQSLGENKDDLIYHMTSHLRLNAIYWGLTALCVMNRQDALDREEMIAFVMSCWDEEAGGFGAHSGHDAHIHATLSAIQILILQDASDKIDVPRVVNCEPSKHIFHSRRTLPEMLTEGLPLLVILSLQQPSGVFAGDAFGEIDTRFSYIAVQSLSLLGQLDKLNVDKTVSYVLKCRNFDGGFGAVVGAESHAAMVFVCVALLAILDKLDEIDQETLAWWLAERQLPNGGLNGRPQKLEDVCYSFWVLSAMSILGKLTWIDADKLIQFILSAQDPENGGIADRPGDQPDVFHTLFGVAGLSLLGYPGLETIDPAYCLPESVTKRLGLRKNWKALPKRT
ncbi:rab geranylgeranyltransferase [Cristinia sonorae]|uniref:Geranylgeranyl transferase type-2 subunit beta n=1 Tax=Cristinia sonorae TaxID=1940300 RepID=A0A8K0UUP9_9AGAR|nr:rab geranylgeranyltransferase [Cristinia sonorae]